MDQNFDIESRSASNVLFCGTTLLTIDSSEIKNLKNSFLRGIKNKKTCVCLVIRTNFYTNKVAAFKNRECSFDLFSKVFTKTAIMNGKLISIFS